MSSRPVTGIGALLGCSACFGRAWGSLVSVVVIRAIPFEKRPFSGAPGKTPYGATEMGACGAAKSSRERADSTGSLVVALRQARIFRETEREKRPRGTRTIRRNTIAYRDCSA